jgi:hypothetical protein
LVPQNRQNLRAFDSLSGDADRFAHPDDPGRAMATITVFQRAVIHSMRQVISYGRFPDYLADRSI